MHNVLNSIARGASVAYIDYYSRVVAEVANDRDDDDDDDDDDDADDDDDGDDRAASLGESQH